MKSNMKRLVVKMVMFISSYFPLYIMLLFLHFDKLKTIFSQPTLKKVVFLVCMGLCILVSLISTLVILSGTGTKQLTISELERPDDTVISYMMTYIIPILSIDFQEYGVIAVNFIMFLMIGHLYVRLNLLYLNPLWSIVGFLAYRVNAEVVVITNIKFSELKKLDKLKGYYVGNDIFIARKINNKI